MTPAAKTDWLTDTTHVNDANGSLTKKDDGTNVHAYKYDFRNLMTDYDGPGRRQRHRHPGGEGEAPGLFHYPADVLIAVLPGL
jgi:hypothetical protein